MPRKPKATPAEAAAELDAHNRNRIAVSVGTSCLRVHPLARTRKMHSSTCAPLELKTTRLPCATAEHERWPAAHAHQADDKSGEIEVIYCAERVLIQSQVVLSGTQAS